MRAFTEPLHELSGFEEMTKEAQKTGLITISGCIDAQKSHMIYGIGNGRKNKVIVTFHEQKAKELYDDYRFFEPNTVYYPAKDILFYQSDIRGNLLTAERIRALRAIHEQQEVTVITTFDALMNTMAPPKTLWDSIRRIEPGDTVVLDELVARLVQMGYEKEYQVDTVGQFALRGGILDVYPLTEDNPVRIEMWGDEVDTIRSFDVESQKSIENLEELVIYPACELVLDDEEKQAGIARFLKEAKTFASKLKKEMKTEEAHRALSTAQELAEEWGELSVTAGMDAYLSYFSEERVGLLDYFDPADTYLFFDELSRCTERGKQTEVEFAESMKQRLEKGYILPGQMKELFGFKEVMGKIERYSCIAVSALDVKTNGLKSNGQYGIHVKSVNAYNNSFELLIKDLQHYKKNGYRIILLSGSRTRAERLASDIMNEGLNCFYTDDYDHELLPGQIMVCYGKVHKGYEYPILQFAVITETDIFGAERKKRKRHRTYEGEKIQSFTALNVGDYVVHENHGLGVYKGIEKIEVDHKVKDYIKIEYAGGSNLYILATQLELIQKYAGKDARKPKLNKLGGQEWGRTKTKVRGAVKEIAQDLVKLYAAREEQNGYVYGPDTVWQREFEEMFPFEETEDQLLAIDATKKDMESTKIMDRLICGDVGYGKTEIAIRAAFKAVQEGKQVVLFLRDLPEGGYDDTINAGDTLYYNYYRVDENTYGDESNIIDSSYFSIFPYDKAYNRYLLDYNNTHDFNPDYKLMEKLEAAYDACVAPQVAAVVKVTDEVMEDFNGIIPTFGYYTAIASINMAQQAVDRQKDIMERLIGEELSGDMDFELCYNQISIKYDLTSTFSATNNKIGVYFNNNDISYSSNVDIKNTYRTQLINSILQYGITIIAMIVMQLLIMAIVIRNRINRRKEKMMLLHSLGMRRGKIVSVCMLEALRESVWCVITMPLLLLMELLMFTGFVRKL